MVILKIDKPKWFTSYDIVEKFKRLFWWEKVWHSWTLDPMATGLLIIAIWKNHTPYLKNFLELDKEYITKIDFSIYSDTRDLDYFDTLKKYKVVTENNIKWIIKDNCFVSAPYIEQIKKHLNNIIPYADLPLTMFSAKKIDWKKLYELAREGIDLKLVKKMKINYFEILEYKFPVIKLKINVWSWTYIRSIWYRLWKQFWLPWTLIYLRRTKIWNIEID